ncbi:O-antigen ligase family protein [Pontibacter pamirensis]|uniref:O-antigen ligase family protein n=1 Tax=Pontibacter pamirensis TaxID=2562824 RepID=UPI00138950E8|nr:O-antigen ligase family protein [Pontibacter pamirensis]
MIGVESSRLFTIPIRIVTVLLLAVSFLCAGRKRSLHQPLLISFIVFSLLYVGRILIEILKGSSYHISNESFLLYFLSFGFFPFLLLFLKKDYPVDYKLYKYAVLISGFLLAVLTIVFYREYIGTVGRISLAVSRDENYMSPLALSYSGSMSMGVALSLLFTTENSKYSKIGLVSVAILSCVPFFLGASRGSVIALIVPFLLFIAYQKNKVKSMRLLLVLIFVSFLVVTLSEYFGSSVISRFVGIESDISEGSSSASRITIWDIALEHFYNNPIFGDSLEVRETGNHPHNIFIEVLLTTGILGMIPFLYLIIKAFKNSVIIIKNNPESSWIMIIFLQSLIQHLFSGSIYSASWLWFSLYFVLSNEVVYKNIESSEDAGAKLVDSQRSLISK